MRRTKIKKRADALSIFTFLLLIVYSLGLFIPVIWSLLTSVTNIDRYFEFYVQRDFVQTLTMTLENFKYAWDNLHITAPGTQVTYNILGLYINSLTFSISGALSATLCTVLVSYLTARYDFGFSKVVYTFVIVAMSFPIVGSMASEIQMLENLGIFGQWVSVPILRFSFLNVYFLVFHALFKGIPRDYTEAAKIDGASNMNIMLRIMMPQAKNMMVTVFVLNFITHWNDYQIPHIYIPDYPVATYGVFYFMNVPQGGGITTNIPVQMAGVLIMTLPVLLVFIIFNKRLRISVSMGGVKG